MEEWRKGKGREGKRREEGDITRLKDEIAF
jgi:hypothetical protein